MRHQNRTTYAVSVKYDKELLFRHVDLNEAGAKQWLGHYTLLWVQGKLDMTHFIVYLPSGMGEPVQVPINTYIPPQESAEETPDARINP